MVPKAFIHVEDGTPNQQIPNSDNNARHLLMLWICAGGVLLVGINLAITLSLTLGMNSTGAQTVYPRFSQPLRQLFGFNCCKRQLYSCSNYDNSN